MENTSELLQFSGEARCDGCKTHDLKCVASEDDERCLSCTAASRPCAFSRAIVVPGPRGLVRLRAVLQDASLDRPLKRIGGLLIPDRAPVVRKTGACESCKKRKIKVWVLRIRLKARC